MKDKKYELTVFGTLISDLDMSEDVAQLILETLELIGRRKGYNQPAIILKGRDSELVDVKYKKDRKK